MAKVRLEADAKTARLTGWRKSSQTFIGEDNIRMVSDLVGEDPSCR
jgi:hypothetical protein